MAPKKIKLYILLLFALSASWSCKIFLGDWGKEGDPCEDNAQCKDSLECFEPAKTCLSEAHLDKFKCTNDDPPGETCEDHLGSNWRCVGGECAPKDIDEVRWCLDAPGVCQEDETCAMGILCKKNVPDEFLGIVCDPQTSKPCGEGASYVCAPFRKPGENTDQYHCTPKCNSNDDCPGKYSCTLVAGGGLYCAKQEWTSGMGFVCEDKSECPMEHPECVPVEYGAPSTSRKICSEPCGSCEAGYTCCQASEQSDEFCLMGYLCYGGCTPDCSTTECGMDPSSCDSCGSCSDGEHCEDGTCVTNPVAPKFPLVLDIGNTDIGSIASVSISGQTGGVFYVAHSGTAIGGQGASTWEITTNPTSSEPDCQKGIPCVTGGPSQIFPQSSIVSSVSFSQTSSGLAEVALGKISSTERQIWLRKFSGNSYPLDPISVGIEISLDSMLSCYPNDKICTVAQFTSAGSQDLQFDKISLMSEVSVGTGIVSLETGYRISDITMSESSLHSVAVSMAKTIGDGGYIAIVNTITNTDSLHVEMFKGPPDSEYKHYDHDITAMTFVPDPDPEQGTIVVALDHNASNPIRFLSSEVDQGTGQITWHEEKSFPLPHYDQNIIALASTLHPSYDETNKLRVLLGLEESGIIDTWTIDENNDLNFLGDLTATDFEVLLGLGDLAVSPVDRADPSAAYMAASGNAKVLLWPLESFLRTTVGFGYPCDPNLVDADKQCSDYNENFPTCSSSQHFCVRTCSQDNDCWGNYICNASKGFCIPN